MNSHRARKRFGQNFLIDASVVAAIVAAIAPAAMDKIVEIGPGQGALTASLLPAVATLEAIEIDRDLAALLGRRYPQLHLYLADALQFDFASLGSDLRLVGNLPYNISTPLLFHLAQFAASIRDAHFMLQQEVVERMVAKPGGGEYGRLSVMLQYRFAMEYLFSVPPQAFSPRPQVDSAVVRMMPRRAAELGAKDEALLGKVVAAAFSQRRKMLRNTLRDLVGSEELQSLNIAPTQRAEELSVDDYVRLANFLSAADG